MVASLTVRARRHVLDVDATFDLETAPITVLFGPSGAGKTTLLRVIAGLDRPASGARVALDGETWVGERRFVPARRRGIGLVFQDGALFPHLSVVENVAYGLRGSSPTARRLRVGEVLEQVGGEHLVGTRVVELSGGERQRIALARALAPRPRLLLLDEPFSALDAPTRVQLQRRLRALVSDTRTPALVVTHDRSEVIALADHVAVLLDGRIRQRGTVEQAFSAPVDADVAAAVGTETAVAGVVVATREGVTTVDVGGVTLSATASHPLPPGEPVIACVRGENVALAAGDVESSARNRLPARVVDITDHGPILRVDLDAGFPLVAYVTRPARDELHLRPGSRVSAVVKAPAVHLVPRGRRRHVDDHNGY